MPFRPKLWMHFALPPNAGGQILFFLNPLAEAKRQEYCITQQTISALSFAVTFM